MITIRHTHAEGTLAEGTSRGDGSNVPLKAAGFRWSRQVGAWYLPHSRDSLSKSWAIGRAVEALKAAGFEVSTDIDDTSEGRAFAEAEAERYERAERRADYHESAAGSAAAKADAAWSAEHGILDMIPMGQPILVGHHSERRHRRDLERAESLRRRGMAEAERSEYHADRAETAERFQARRESIPTTLRRIAGLEADERRILRKIQGGTRGQHPYTYEAEPATGAYLERLTAALADVREQLTYWREHVKAAEAAGAKIWSRDDFTKGDFVQFLGSWYEVLRVSAKSVTIPAMINDGPVVRREGARCTWTDTVPYHKVKGRKSADEMAAALATPAGR